jgi:hypothetical protein
MALSLDQERGAWVLYSNLHILTLGGVPASADMREFAPRLWQEQTRVEAIYHVYNDDGLSADAYIRTTTPLGRSVRVDERLAEAKKDAVDKSAAAEDAAGELLWSKMRRGELWKEACRRIVSREHERARESFDTSGFSCQGIVPRPPAVKLQEG